MTAYLLILISALLLALAATPVAKRVAYRFGIIDKPNARKVHSVPTPLLGGAAIFAAVLLALVILGDRFYASQVAGILLGATLMSFMGLWDDRRGLSPWIKLAGQCGAAAILTVTDVRIGLFPWEPLNYAATILWVVGITNAMNLLDNMDGLSGGIAAIAALFFLLFADEPPVSRRRACSHTRRRMSGLPVLQPESCQHLHGRHGQPVSRLHAGASASAALPGEIPCSSHGWCRRWCWPCPSSTRAWSSCRGCGGA